jgi:superfamily II DNA or RNA helicase
MIKEAVKRGKKCIIVVRGRKLVEQASQRLLRENVDHGVLMAGHRRYWPTLPVQVVSVDTAISRKLSLDADLLVIDECHLAVSEGYRNFIFKFPNAFIVACTATPWGGLDMTHIADSVVHPINMQGLINEGYLVPFKAYGPPGPDLRGVHISSSTKDYVVEELASVINTGGLTGKIIDHWKKLAADRPTLMFAVNVEHSKNLVETFNHHGIKVEHADANTSDAERNKIISRLESGETKVISNVGIFSLGVDVPCISALIMARPTRSYNLFVQQCGRGTRIFPNKKDCLILDHAGNIDRHCLPTDEPEVNLHGKEKPPPRTYKTCPECFLVHKIHESICPACGHIYTKKEMAGGKDLSESDEELKEIDPIKLSLSKLVKEAKSKSRRIEWAYYKLIDRFGLEISKKYLPIYFINRYEEKFFQNSPYRSINE